MRRRRGPGLRRWLGAGLVAAAAALGLRALAPAPPRLVPVVVAQRDVAAGQRLAAGDLRVAGWLPGTGPPRAVASIADAVGRVSAGPLVVGAAVTDADLLGPGLLTGQPADLLAVPVRVAESGSSGLVRRGDRVDLIAVGGSGSAGSGSSGVVARDVVVLADLSVANADAGLGGLSGGGGVASVGVVIVVGASLADAERLARAQAAGPISLAVHRP